jgi:hypothetical protein
MDDKWYKDFMSAQKKPYLSLWNSNDPNLKYYYKSINDWFKANLLTLNFDKRYFIQFLTKNSDAMDMHIVYGNNQIAKSTNTKFSV